ncbi:translation initiation factor eIF4G [Schizosaccharomyces octosporus yFS286]|uniref:Translation initiation factor eIF4G n=1 Tax=Schizosaccharomyces octosporus (strain yFS286) TaxID=483514 RepID=S9Q020_SCHOY|nr:translation initiation factor eIF4G [Schizosaccharomyces octosporus yFS286]EPX73058.1 translation initiation factor eIF4G [Schizosaccharomyces octosporus yFS286]
MSSKPPSNTQKFSYARALAASQSMKNANVKPQNATSEKPASKPAAASANTAKSSTAGSATTDTHNATGTTDASDVPQKPTVTSENKADVKDAKDQDKKVSSKPANKEKPLETASNAENPVSANVSSESKQTHNAGQKTQQSEGAAKTAEKTASINSDEHGAKQEQTKDAIESTPSHQNQTQNSFPTVPIQFGSITRNAPIATKQHVKASVPSNQPKNSVPPRNNLSNSIGHPGSSPVSKGSRAAAPSSNNSSSNDSAASAKSNNSNVAPESADPHGPNPVSSTPSLNGSGKPHRQNRHYERYGNSYPSYNKYSPHYQHGYTYKNNGRNDSQRYNRGNGRRQYNNGHSGYPPFVSNGRNSAQNPRNTPQGMGSPANPVQMPVSIQPPYGQVYGQAPYIVDPNMMQFGAMLQPGYVPQYYPVYPQTPYTPPTFPNMSRSTSQVSEPVMDSPNSSTPISSRSGNFTPIVKQQKKSSALKIVNPATNTEVVVPQKNKSQPKSGESSPRLDSAVTPHLTEEEVSKRKDAVKQAVQQRIQEKAEEEARRHAEEQAKREAEEKAKREAEEKAKREAEEKAKREAEEQAKREAEEQAKREAEEKAKREAEEKVKREAEEKAKREAEEQAKREAEEKAKRESEEQAKREAEEKAKQEAEEKTKHEAEERARKEIEEKAKVEVEAEGNSKSEELPKSDDQKEIKPKSENIKTSSESSLAESRNFTPKREVLSGVESLKSQPKPSASLDSLLQASIISDISKIVYPSSIKRPATEGEIKDGKLLYDIPFLMQFQTYYTDKPAYGWDEKMKGTVASAFSDKSSRGGYGSSRQSSRSGSTRDSHAGSGFGGHSDRKSMSRLGVDRGFGDSGGGFRSGSNYKSAPSRGMSHHGHGGSHRGSQRGSRRGGGGGEREKPDPSTLTIPAEQVQPLQLSANRWQPKKLAEKPEVKDNQEDLLPLDVIQRKVKGSLNKMTLEKFEKISDQILEMAMQSRRETDGRTLRLVIQLTFEKATDEPNFSNMYARFARKMMDSIDDSIRDENVLDKNGQPVRGGLLFRKYLLSRCQEDFERGWKANLPAGGAGEAEIMSDEYYVAAAIKRRGLGLVRFIGELFKLSMLSEKIMHECIKRLLGNVTDPEEEEIESLCKLLMTVGVNIDATEKGHAAMDVYVLRMETITKIPNLPSRIKFMLLDVIDSRRAGWNIKKEIEKGPKTIQEIHEEAERKKALSEAQRPARMHRDMNRGDSRTGGRGSNPPFGSNDWSNNKDGYARLGQGIRGLKSGTQGSHGPTSLSSMLRGGNVSRSPSRQSSTPRREPARQAPANQPLTSANSFELLEEQDHDNDGSSNHKDPTSTSKTNP